MREQVYTWLGEYLSVPEENSKDKKVTAEDIQDLLKDETATLFLLIWPIMEQNVFHGYMKKGNIDAVARQAAGSAQKPDINDIFLHFHQRYQDKDARHHLQHRDTNDIFNETLKKTAGQVTDQEKIAFLFYVVYRYRNNIFHGNKGIKSWSQYTKQITYCLNFMMKIIDWQSKSKMKENAE